jgi:putative DNA methylase
MEHWAELFTNRQLVALTTFSDLVTEAHYRIKTDARKARLSADEAALYGNAAAAYLGLSASRLLDRHASVATWDASPTKEQVRGVFARQAISMAWDCAESNPFSRSSGNLAESLEWVARVVDKHPGGSPGKATQADASTRNYTGLVVSSTDPPYYDNIGYADLADFFYVWLRRSLRDIYPGLLDTMLTPKDQELVATPYRFGGSKIMAEEHFEAGLIRTFTRIRKAHPPDVPVTVFYAFKQAETDDEGIASTGWETMLAGLIEAGFSVSATWPMRSELSNRIRAFGSNVLASSIILACRPRPDTAEATTRRGFIQALKSGLPRALREMEQGSIAPVDLAQAAIGPGMRCSLATARWSRRMDRR